MNWKPWFKGIALVSLLSQGERTSIDYFFKEELEQFFRIIQCF